MKAFGEKRFPYQSRLRLYVTLVPEAAVSQLAHLSESNAATYADTIQACADSRALEKGKKVHAQIVRKGMDGDAFLGNKLIQMYLKCGAVADARQTFNRLKEQTVVTWTVNIAAYAQSGYYMEAIRLFKEMQQNGMHPDKVAVVTALGACASCESLVDGKQLHSLAAELGLELNSTVGSALINMYGKCDSLDAAIEVFGKLDHTLHVGAWSSLLGAFTNSRQDRALQALTFYRQMQLEGVRPDSVALVTCVKACTLKNALKEGKELHQQIRECGLESDIILANALVNMFGKSGSPEDAFMVFARIERPNIISWTSIVGTYAQYSHLGGECMVLFQKMQLEGVRPNKVTMVAVLRACKSAEGRQVHERITEAGIFLEVTVGNALVDMYCKCGEVDDAQSVLRSMFKRDVISWNVMISGYAQHGGCKDSVKCLWEMHQDGLIPTKVTYVTLLNACSTEEDLAEGKVIHRSIIDSGLHTDEVIKSFLLGMYGKCGSLEDVQRSSAEVSDKNTIAWNTVIGALARYGHHQQAFQHFQVMQLEGIKPDAVTFVLILGTCNSSSHLACGTAVHGWLLQLGFDSVIILNALVVMYAKCGTLEAAQEAFDNISSRSSVSWNSMISACIQHSRYSAAYSLFRKMQLEGVKPDEVTFISMVDACSKNSAAPEEGRGLHQILNQSGFGRKSGIANALIVMYGKLNDLQAATNVFDSMVLRNTVSWNTIIAAHVEKGLNKEALKLFWRIKDAEPDRVTFLAALNACSNLTEVRQIHRLLEALPYHHQQDVVVATALVNMYGKCGSPEEARQVFQGMRERDVVSWTSLIVAYAQHNECGEAMKVMRAMEQEGVKVDDVVFVSVLSGCDHAGLLEAGCTYFVSMVDDYGLIPRLEHFNCMIDILGRAGHLDVAEKLIDRLPSSRRDYKVWMTLLSACRMHDSNAQRGIRAAQRIVELDPGNPAAYVVLSNMYAG